jgi:hypothetical protein
MRISRRVWSIAALALLPLLAAGAASASEIKKIGVMSVLGRELQVVIHAPTTGSRVDRNAKDTIKMGPGDFENFVLSTTQERARREGLGEALLLARPANGSMPWQRDGQAVMVTRSLLEAAQAAKLSHLVLIQPARAEAKLQMLKTAIGSGQLEGLGFYVDTTVDVEMEDTKQMSSGFLAPYAYFDMYLVEVATLDLQAEYRARASIALADPVRQGADPWQALSAERKVEVIRKLIQEEVEKAVHGWAQPAAASAPAR